jgi:hypothetical protein
LYEWIRGGVVTDPPPPMISAATSSSCRTVITSYSFSHAGQAPSRTLMHTSIDWERVTAVEVRPTAESDLFRSLVFVEGGVSSNVNGTQTDHTLLVVGTGSATMPARLKRAMDTILSSCSTVNRLGF